MKLRREVLLIIIICHTPALAVCARGNAESQRFFKCLCISATHWLIYFFDLPIQSGADGSLTDFWPLRARRARDIDIE